MFSPVQFLALLSLSLCLQSLALDSLSPTTISLNQIISQPTIPPNSLLIARQNLPALPGGGGNNGGGNNGGGGASSASGNASVVISVPQTAAVCIVFSQHSRFSS